MFIDTLRNLVSGLGIPGKDKAASSTAVHIAIDRMEIDALYRGDGFARKVVDIPAFDSVREWRAWQADAEQITALEAEEKRLDIRSKVKQALTWSKLYGGAALLLHDGGPSLEAELKIRGKGGLKAVMGLHRYRLKPGDRQWDPTQPGFDQPQWWEFTDAQAGMMGVRIHPSRVVRFTNNPIPDPEDATSADERVWGDGVYQSIVDTVKRAEATNAAIASLVEEAKVDVIKMPQFMASVGSKEYRDRVAARIELAAVLKSIHNAVLIDAAEEWERKEVDFSNLDKIQINAMQWLAAIADIPATRFLAQSPAGLNATGDADLRNYYDGVNAKQEVDLTPAMFPLDEAIITSALGGRPEGIWYEWRPLWQLTPKEAAEINKINADAAKVYAESRMIPSAALALGVQNALIEAGTYPGLEQAIQDAQAGRLLPFEEPVDDMGQPIGGPRPKAAPGAQEGKPGAKTPAAANENHEITVNGPGGLSIKAKVKKQGRRDALVTDAAPRSLYVHRRLLNAQQVQRWARDQGLTGLVPQAEMHTTIAYSRAGVDWMAVGSDYWGDPSGRVRIPAGGARLVERLGDKGAVVLLFAAEAFTYRHERIKEAGASWDFDEYQPHVTLGYGVPDDFDLSKVEPFRGSLLFGPEIFAEIDEEWSAT